MVKVKLKDGSIVTLRWQRTDPKKEDPKKFLKFINPIIREGAYILVNKPVTLNAERKWVEESCKKIRRGELMRLIAEKDGRIIGTCDATRGKFKEKNNVEMGIAIAKDMRRKGLGYIMLTTVIKKVKEKWKPKNIVLAYIKGNIPAQRLYTKLGFKEFAVFPKWVKHKNRYYDRIWMKL